MLKRNKRFLLMLLTLALPFGCVGCVSDGGSATYEQISGAEAKALMDSESEYIIIDARTWSEYDEGHIPGAILIPEYEIADRAEKELPDNPYIEDPRDVRCVSFEPNGNVFGENVYERDIMEMIKGYAP